MRKASRVLLLPFLVVCLAVGGCGKKEADQGNPGVAPPGPDGGPLPGAWGPGGGGNPELRQAMMKIGRGPKSLHPLLKQELQEAQPAWDKIGPQAAEYAQLAATLEKATPTKGSKESWSKLSAAFVESAQALEKAAQAKDSDAAGAAIQKLDGSCMECHREHRGGRGPRGPGRGKPGGEGAVL